MEKYGYKMTTLISNTEIQNRIQELADEISAQFMDEIPMSASP